MIKIRITDLKGPISLSLWLKLSLNLKLSDYPV
jgi:hypothetical protein